MIYDVARRSLQHSRDVWFCWLVASTVVVAIGVILEGGEVLIGWVEAFLNLHIKDRLKKWFVLASAIGWIVVSAGVTAEFAFEVLVSRADSRLQNVDLAELRETERKTAELGQSNIQLGLDLEAAKTAARTEETILATKLQNAESARKAAAKAELERDRYLARHIWGREPDPSLFEPLKRAPKAIAEIWYKRDDGEAYLWAVRIRQNLIDIGWSVPRDPIPAEPGPTPLLSTSVFIKPRKILPEEIFPNKEHPTTLGALMVAIRGQAINTDSSLPDNFFRIVVGQRPPWWMPE